MNISESQVNNCFIEHVVIVGMDTYLFIASVLYHNLDPVDDYYRRLVEHASFG